jgi:hypothetical protein
MLKLQKPQLGSRSQRGRVVPSLAKNRKSQLDRLVERRILEGSKRVLHTEHLEQMNQLDKCRRLDKWSWFVGWDSSCQPGMGCWQMTLEDNRIQRSIRRNILTPRHSILPNHT